MAKDDYDVIVYRILVYLYACLKHKIMFEEEVFLATVCRNVESEEYFADILRMMQKEGYIEGLVFANPWGNEWILGNDIENARITPEGIHYLQDNSRMKKVGEMLKESVDIIAKLASLIKLI